MISDVLAENERTTMYEKMLPMYQEYVKAKAEYAQVSMNFSVDITVRDERAKRCSDAKRDLFNALVAEMEAKALPAVVKQSLTTSPG